ncbi:hypothetical protein GCM10025864_12630 [Luteimicrobium album]|uniref:Uncharacterized protein n=1 Tax=Luteimicrobium album TaxID=1054550 RepID=A0ABQ6I0L5_9MICO|nr:hypothetical protein GCM10025864_12630 [Luteimicrobium album]
MSFTSAIASSSVRNARTGAIGAKTSSVHSDELRGTPVTTVGRKNKPSRVPPSTTVAPAATASRSSRSPRAAWRSLIMGPIPVAVSEGSPTVILAARAASLATYSSTMLSCTRWRPALMQVCPW